MMELHCPACGVDLVEMGRSWVPFHTAYVCLNCRAVLTIDAGTQDLRYPTDDEEMFWLRSPGVKAAQAHVAEHHRRYGPPMSHRPDDGRG